MFKEQIQKSSQEVYSDQHQKLEVSVFQPWAKQKDHKEEGQPCIMQARHLMSSKLKLTPLQDLRLSYKSQNLFSMAANAQRMAHVALLSKDLSEIKAKFKL